MTVRSVQRRARDIVLSLEAEDDAVARAIDRLEIPSRSPSKIRRAGEIAAAEAVESLAEEARRQERRMLSEFARWLEESGEYTVTRTHVRTPEGWEYDLIADGHEQVLIAESQGGPSESRCGDRAACRGSACARRSPQPATAARACRVSHPSTHASRYRGSQGKQGRGVHGVRRRGRTSIHVTPGSPRRWAVRARSGSTADSQRAFDTEVYLRPKSPLAVSDLGRTSRPPRSLALVFSRFIMNVPGRRCRSHPTRPRRASSRLDRAFALSGGRL